MCVVISCKVPSIFSLVILIKHCQIMSPCIVNIRVIIFLQMYDRVKVFVIARVFPEINGIPIASNYFIVTNQFPLSIFFSIDFFPLKSLCASWIWTFWTVVPWISNKRINTFTLHAWLDGLEILEQLKISVGYHVVWKSSVDDFCSCEWF